MAGAMFLPGWCPLQRKLPEREHALGSQALPNMTCALVQLLTNGRVTAFNQQVTHVQRDKLLRTSRMHSWRPAAGACKAKLCYMQHNVRLLIDTAAFHVLLYSCQLNDTGGLTTTLSPHCTLN